MCQSSRVSPTFDGDGPKRRNLTTWQASRSVRRDALGQQCHGYSIASQRYSWNNQSVVSSKRRTLLAPLLPSQDNHQRPANHVWLPQLHRVRPSATFTHAAHQSQSTLSSALHRHIPQLTDALQPSPSAQTIPQPSRLGTATVRLLRDPPLPRRRTHLLRPSSELPPTLSLPAIRQGSSGKGQLQDNRRPAKVRGYERMGCNQSSVPPPSARCAPALSRPEGLIRQFSTFIRI